MIRTLQACFVAGLFGGLLAGHVSAQNSPSAPAMDASESSKQGIELATQGRCKEALPILKKAIPHVADKRLKYRDGMATARCAMSVNDTDTALYAIALLNREFRDDPEVLYVTTHYYSELASRTASELATTSPASYQALELDAEAYESQGKWAEATAQYKKILEQNPELPDIHFRLGRILLSEPPTATSVEEARNELEAEIKVNPANASAEYALGEIARQTQHWDEATAHYSRATKLDEGFLEAFLGLGMALNATGKFPEAVAPLEKYVKMLPADPAGHYQLAIAYARTGHKEEADRQMALQREINEKSQQKTQ
jgi:tetratricopeptide (TPR) repeat protein